MRSIIGLAQRFLVEQAPEVVGAQAGIAKNAGEGASADFLVERDDECVPASYLLQPDMTSPLPDGFPVVLAQRFDQALAGDDRLTRAHAGSGIVRRITPLSSGSPSSRR